MNTGLTVKNIEVDIDGTPIKIGEIHMEVTDYNILEGIKAYKEMPAILREFKDVIVDTIRDVKAEFAEPDTQGLTPNVDLAIRNLADVMDVDPTQIKVVRPEQVEEPMPSF